MADLTTAPVSAALRELAREQLAGLEQTLRAYAETLTLGERLELSVPLLRMRELLHGTAMPPDSRPAPSNVNDLGVRRKPAGTFYERVEKEPEDLP